MRKRILFVDDEPEILAGLRRMLRKYRHDWDMDFVESGQEALRLFDQAPYDVIITDMRMPGMDGADLLEKIARRFPSTVRIILSGYSDQEMVMRTVSVAHQYLSKPCDAETLRRVIEQAALLRATIYNSRVKEVVSGLATIPSCPSLYLQIISALKSPDTSLQTIGDIISRDVGMTAKILQLVNSAFFGLSRKITNVSQAVGILGLETIRILVLIAGVFKAFEYVRIPGFDMEQLWTHAMAVGTCAKKLATTMEKDNPAIVDASYLAGMLHDVGKFVLAAAFPESVEKAIKKAVASNKPLYESEEDLFQTTHAEVGAYLMGIWGLPDDIVTAIAFHHVPSKVGDSPPLPLLFVHAANGLSHLATTKDTPESREGEKYFDDTFLKKMEATEKLEEWKTICEDVWPQGEDNGEKQDPLCG